MNWSELSARDKIRILIEEVMGWTCYYSWDEFQAALRKGGDLQTLNYPVAYWNTQLGYERWTVIHRNRQSGDTFNPLESMDDAWLVAESPRFQMVRLSRYSADHPQFRYSCTINDGGDGEAQTFASSVTDSICRSALTLVGALDWAGKVLTKKEGSVSGNEGAT
jgi:hypothetical protein